MKTGNLDAFFREKCLTKNRRIHIVFRFEDEYRKLLEKRADMEQEVAG